MLKTNSKILRRIALSSLIAASATATVQAKEGFYLGLNTSNGTFSHTIERDTGSNLTPSITTRVEESDIAVGLRAGYDFKLAGDFFLGIEAFYDAQNIETTNINNLLRTQLELNSTYGARLKAGVDVNDKLSVYGSLGATTLDFDIRNSYPFAPPVREDSADENDLSFGFGLEYSIADQWAITAEYTQINDVDFDPIPEVAVPGKINPNEVDYSSLSFGINYRF